MTNLREEMKTEVNRYRANRMSNKELVNLIISMFEKRIDTRLNEIIDQMDKAGYEDKQLLNHRMMELSDFKEMLK